MEFRNHASVKTWERREVGHVDRVVLDPTTKRVTHVVIRKGRLFNDDRLVAVDDIAEASDKVVVLKKAIGDVKALPRFEEAHYVPVNDTPPSATMPIGGSAPVVYGYPPLPGGRLLGQPHVVKAVEQNIPPGTVAVKEGATVLAEDGQVVGKIEEVFTDTGTRQATHILISKGLLLKERKLVPTFWIRLFGEDEVHLAAPASVLEKLRPYEN